MILPEDILEIVNSTGCYRLFYAKKRGKLKNIIKIFKTYKKNKI